MNKLIAGLFGAALMSGAAIADTGAPAPSAKDLTKAVEKVNYVETDVSGVRLNGYVDVGYIYNFVGNNIVTNRFGTDGGRAGEFNVNTVKLTLEKPLSNKNQWEAGFRTDLMLGKDADTLANNNQNPSSVSNFYMEQAYVVFRAPFGNGIDIKAGKFVSWLGYEVTERPANMNITYSDLYAFLPNSMTGVSFEYPICNSFDVGFAIGNGTKDSNFGFDNSGDGYGMMAKVNYKVPGGNANWQNSLYYTWDSAGEIVSPYYNQDNNNAAIYDSVFNWAPKFANGKLLLGAEGTLGYAENTTNNGSSSTLWGAGVYAKYQFTDIFSLAGRYTFVHSDDFAAFNANNQASAIVGDAHSFTLTAGFNVVENLTIRAEYRCDLGSYQTSAGTGDLANSVAVQAVYTF